MPKWGAWENHYIESQQKDIIVKSTSKYFPKIKIIGCGGAGINMLDNLVEILQIPDECFIVIDSNSFNLDKSKVKNKIQLGEGGNGTGSNFSQAKEFAEDAVDKILEFVGKVDFIVLFCGIGGGTGTGASPVILQCVKRTGATVISFVTTPFDYEKKEWDFIYSSLEEIKKSSDFTNVVSNNVLGKQSDLSKAFRYLDEFYARVINIIFSIVYKQSTGIQHILGADVADLKFVMGHNGYGFVTVGYGEDDNAALDSVQSCFRNQFIFSQLKLETAGSLMVNIISNDHSVSIKDIETIFDFLYVKFTNKKLNIIHSFSIVPEPSELFSSKTQGKKVFLVLTAAGIELSRSAEKKQSLSQVIKDIQFV
jgi:cell division protein FtsZ